ncbi:3-oxoacyl-[acyl-carrier protein] reductase [Halospina denitrificans]|uniref:3-oxoacyl-[acyl-carrier protein] reductase n=1 Tax=Halospina denitrificans TaxID=332522 RepID=A0A4R7JYA3_9GAMM|nr:3-oxoacyl-ACP reductase [Halospina denitrificans]TDT43155.1 3-oxoacyl-[acyl-carrier protein] reductase [Halospina denitrificans]
MSDLYLKLVNTSLGKQAVSSLGLPAPIELERWKRQDQPFLEGKVLLGAGPRPRALATLTDILRSSAGSLHIAEGPESLNESASATESGAGKAVAMDEETLSQHRFKALILDATGVKDTTELRCLYDFFHNSIRQLAKCGRVLVIGTDPASCKSPARAAAHKALEGFVRSVGKEIGKKGATAQLLWVAPNAENQLESSVRFFLSPKSAYVSGQPIRIGKGGSKGKTATNTNAPLTGKVALVTGASRGIGEAIARTLARDGARVVCLDIPATMEDLNRVAEDIGGSPLAADITEDNAPRMIADHLEDEFGGIDIVVHNAGVTRDKTLGRMPEHFWDMTIAINLTAEERIDEELSERDLMRENGRIVCVSSIAGFAGNFGQTNYAASKAGVIGYVESMARQLKNGITINAVAPGFIETQMTAAMPVTIREAGRRMNSLSQGGLPVDVAETIAWYCNPLSRGVNGNVVRVCGQSLVGK